MLNRVATPSPWAPVNWGAWRRALLDGPAAVLIRYALVLVLLSVIACLYFLQTNELARLNEETLRLEQQAAQIEGQSIALKLQLAQWNSPGYVRGEALKQNYVRNPNVLYINPAAPLDATASQPQPASQTVQMQIK